MQKEIDWRSTLIVGSLRETELGFSILRRRWPLDWVVVTSHRMHPSCFHVSTGALISIRVLPATCLASPSSMVSSESPSCCSSEIR